MAGELAELGLGGEVDTGGVSFRARAGELYQANLSLRVASRVLVRVAEFRATAFWELEKRAQSVPWAEFIAAGRAVAFRVTSRKSKLYHQAGIAERLGSAVSAAVAGVTAREDEGAQEFVVRVFRDRVTISIDSSGALLHLRGYRLASAKAPLRENLGAAILLGARWDVARPLLDPFAGSGTIPIEAALMARKIPPGWQRRFAFEEWPGFDPALWGKVRARAESGILPRAPARSWDPIGTREPSRWRRPTRSAPASAPTSSGATRRFRWRRDLEAPAWIVTNPPYGVRVGDANKLRDLYAKVGTAGGGAVPRLYRGAGGRGRPPGRGDGVYISRRRCASGMAEFRSGWWSGRRGFRSETLRV